MKELLLISTATVLAFASAQAQTQRIFNNAGGDNLWSNAANWSGSQIANTTGEFVQLNGSPIVDQNFSVNRVQTNFGTGANVVSSSNGGVLTIDAGANQAYAIQQVTSEAGSNLQFSGSVRINNSDTGFAISRVGFNTAPNRATDSQVTFASGSTLDLSTTIEVETGANRSMNFNGNIIGGGAMRVADDSQNIIFDTGADNSSYTGEVVFFNNSEVVSQTTVANGFLNTGSKIQVNGTGGSLTLDGAGAMGGNVVIGASNTFTLNANADQAAMGFLNINNGSALTIALGGSVSEFAFGSSASINWGSGTVAVTGFKEGTIRFGTDASGLTGDQLAAIDGGIYSLTDQGYLSIPEPGTYGLIFGAFGLGLSIFRRRR